MKISILMPTFNRPEFISNAINAILEQDYDDWELIIKDGGKPVFDLIPDDKRIIYIHGKDRGITDAMNTAMKIASGDVFNWANDDDRISAGTLQFVAENIKDYKWMYGRIFMGNSPYGEAWNYERLKRGNIVPQPAVFWTREAIEKVGMFDESEDLVSDYEYWLRLGKYFTPLFVDRIMAYYTVHPGQITSRIQAEQLAQAARIRQKYL